MYRLSMYLPSAEGAPAMKSFRFVIATVALCLVGMANADSIPTILYNTGVNSSGIPLPPGAIDPHYTLVSSPINSGPAFVVIDGQFPFLPYFPSDPVWLANSSISEWIGPVANALTAVGGPPGEYIFQTTFDLTAKEAASAELMGRLASDNSVQIFVNGVNTGMGASDFKHFTAFQITSGFVQGSNHLDFVVTNDDCGPMCVNPTGLRVEYRVSEVPEPATLTYVIFGLMGFNLLRRDFATKRPWHPHSTAVHLNRAERPSAR
jgi:hypothetical protein